MTQAELFESRPLTIPEIAQANAGQLSQEFLAWLPENLHIWEAFVAEAFKVIRAGYTHYSARTIIHFLRHHSALQERGGEWKVNNNWSPYLARLFDAVYPQHAGLWEYRETKSL